MSEQTLTIIKPDDFHVHIRNFPEANQYLDDAAPSFKRMLVMPNTVPPLDRAERIIDYRNAIIGNSSKIDPVMTFKLMPSMKPEDLKALKEAGAVAGKLYPRGATTHSEDGVESIEEMFPLFSKMEELGLVLSLHGEDPLVSVLERERSFLPTAEKIVEEFPLLKIVLEHVSTIEGVEFVLTSGPNVAATLTAHHLWFTLDDMMGAGFISHLFCKPVIQTVEDRGVLRAAAVSGNSKFFFGSDSAPHPRSRKETFSSAAGVYSSPVALQAVTQIFDEYGKLEMLEGFVSHFGADFYGLPRNTDTLTLAKKPWKVAEEYSGVVPMLAGRELNWSIKK